MTFLRDIVGQERAVAQLEHQLQGAMARGEPFPHTFFQGPSGVGKSLLAELLTRGFGTNLLKAMGYPYRPLRYVTGRGGTDFKPPLARAFLHKHKPDVVVYFTDGCGPSPELPPPVPVVWCLVGGGESPAKWGRVVRIRGNVLAVTA